MGKPDGQSCYVDENPDDRVRASAANDRHVIRRRWKFTLLRIASVSIIRQLLIPLGHFSI